MPSALPLAQAADPRLGLGLIGLLLALALALLLVWRRDALRAGADPARPAWFAFAIRVHLLLVTAWFVGPAITALAQPTASLTRMFPRLVPLVSILGIVLLAVLPICITLAAVFVAGDVERRLRGSGRTLGERLLQTGTGLVIAMLPLAGLLAASAVLTTGNVRAAVGCALTGFVGALWMAGRRAGVLGLKPEAATAGPLRDRLFELAARAGVRVRQVYVLSASRTKLANAFAVRGGSVLLTDHLLEQLSRREVDAVIAHELAHLRHRHPAKLGAAFAVPFAAILVTLSFVPPFAWLGTAPGIAMAGFAGWVSLLTWAKRFERQADRDAVQLTGDAPALITALVRIARLNAFPVDWSRGEEWVLTHPSVRRRGRARGDAGFVGLAPEEGGATYEGFADWDLGFLELDAIALRYEGERTRFALERDRIVSLALTAGLPGWIPAPRVAIRWRAADGTLHAFSVRNARAVTLHEIAGESRRLLSELEQWHAQPAPAGIRAIGGGEPPRAGAVTGTTHTELASPRTLIPIVPLLVALALLAALAAGLPLTPGYGPGAFEVMGAGLLAIVGLRVPLWRAVAGGRKPAPAPSPVHHEHPAA